MGIDFRIAAPIAYQPDKTIVQSCLELVKISGAKITITDDLAEAVKKVDYLYTDVWVSMGEEKSAWDERIKLLQPFQVNARAISLTNNPKVKFMHCLPALHNRETQLGETLYQHYGLDGVEVTDEVFESTHSIVFDQAENRLHTIKAIMVATLA